jgi:spoIIIJ-associated protein
MSGFFSKLFGGKKKDNSQGAKSSARDSASASESGSAVALVEDVMRGLVEKAQLDLSFDVKSDANGETEEITVELSGPDENLVTEKEGALLDAFQLFIKRVLQHQLPDARVNVSFDSGNFREESSKSLVELAEKLKEKALEQGRSVYLRALPPKDRKIVHQYLANDERVRSRSVGDGLYKKIKIYPVKAVGRDSGRGNDQDTDSGRDHQSDDGGSELSESL